MVENKLKIAGLKSEHSLKIIKKSFLLLGVLLLISLFSISSVNAGEFNSSVTSDKIQEFIDINTTDTKLILNAGTYSGLSNLNVTRSLNITGKGKVNIIGSGGILFNVTTVNITISNLNITGYDTAIQSNTSGISFINNNIDTNGVGIILSSTSYMSTFNSIRFENNIITSVLTAVYINFTNSSIIDVYFDKNNIIGSYGVNIYTNNSTNNMIFTNNAFGGTYALSISARYSTNNITINKNNITAKERGLYLYTLNSDNTMVITNNNIKGTYLTVGTARNGILLEGQNGKNNLTINNNNISQTPKAFYLLVHVANNTITLNNNNIVGGEDYGFYLGADRCNNTISIINNSFTGTVHEGVELFAYSSNNYLLSFVGNNITGNTVALYVNVNNNLLSNLHLENNTLNAIGPNGIALDFNNTYILNNITINGNTINSTNIGIGFYRNVTSMTVNMIANYNRIIAPVGLNFTGVTNNNSNFDYNWWGANDISSKIIDFNVNNHYILKIINLTSLNNLQTGDKVDLLLLVLNDSLNNTGAENLPDFVIKVTVNGVNYNVSHDNGFVYELTVPNKGSFTINTSLDDESDSLSFSASKANVSISAVVPNGDIGDTINIVVNLNENITTTSDVTIGGVTFKNVNFVDGVATIPYTITATFTGNLKIVFIGNDGYNSNNTFINVKFSKGKLNLSVVQKGNSIIVTVTDKNGNPVKDKEIVLKDSKNNGLGIGITNIEGQVVFTYIPTKFSKMKVVSEVTFTYTGNNPTFKVSFNGDGKYESVEVKFKFNKGNISNKDPINDTNNNANNNDTNKNNTNNNNFIASATMKSTGNPIFIVLLVLLSTLGIYFTRRN